MANEDTLNVESKKEKRAEEEATKVASKLPNAAGHRVVVTKSSEPEVATGWEMALKVFGWITFIGCIWAFLVLLTNGEEEISWLPLVIGIIQIAPNMVFANISISLKKANALKKKILNELKQINKIQEEK